MGSETEQSSVCDEPTQALLVARPLIMARTFGQSLPAQRR